MEKKDDFSPEDIKLIRKVIGRSQTSLANILKTSQVTVARWERPRKKGGSKPSPVFRDKLQKIWSAYITEEMLEGREENNVG